MRGRDLAAALEVSEATVSRLASGARRPSTNVMLRISNVLHWSVNQQAQALEDKTYAEKFRKKMTERKPPRATD